MNMANHDYEEQDFEYRFEDTRAKGPDGRRHDDVPSSSKRRMSYGRASRPVNAHNGIHRRRNKRFSW